MKLLQTILLAFPFVLFVHAADMGNYPPEKLIDELFATLPGVWVGEAIETPVGPVDYAIRFHDCSEGVIAGVSQLRVSEHYWRFWKSDGGLRLTFLSTFGDNRDPTQLIPNKFENKRIWFYAPKLALLTLSVTLDEKQIDVRVFHHRKPHVYIHLTRANGSMNESEHNESENVSCKKL